MTHEKIQLKFHVRFDSYKPYNWQLNVGKVSVLRLNCLVIASTGAGKTMPFIIPILTNLMKHIQIVSPLNALEEDQVT